MGLANGQLNSLCLIDSEIVTGSIEVGVCVSPPFCPGMTLNSPPCLVVWFYLYIFSLNFVFVGLLYDPIVTLVVCVHGPHTFLSVD